MAYTNSVTITSSTTWTVPTNFRIDSNHIKCVAAGANYGSGYHDGFLNDHGGGGGGAGAESHAHNTQLVPGSNVTVTVGTTAGGNSSVGSVCVSLGGAVGGNAYYAHGGAGGQGGQASGGTGDEKYSGGDGGTGPTGSLSPGTGGDPHSDDGYGLGDGNDQSRTNGVVVIEWNILDSPLALL